MCRKRILIVEDNRSILKMMLTIFNLRIKSTCCDVEIVPFYSSLACLDYFGVGYSGVDLVISDFNIPGMNGSILYKSMLLIDKDLRFVFLSGCVSDIDLEVSDNLVGIYEKPLYSAIKFVDSMLSLI